VNVGGWLHSLGLGGHEAAFRANRVDAAVLPELTADDLREIGVAAVGDRRRLLAAIAVLRAGEARPPSATPAARTAERRQVAVLFCDLAGSTALSARLDPEDLRAVMATYHRAVTAAVEEHGGYIAKFMGDGVLSYFGWPAAREDDTERAVRAGLAACAAVAELATTAGSLACRVGIAIGEVVVGDLMGEGTAARERGVIGGTPNLAARLQGMAAPGTVVVDAATRRLTGKLFAWEAPSPTALKGFEEVVEAFHATLLHGAIRQ
jgi:class 3 adenylate cyclase